MTSTAIATTSGEIVAAARRATLERARRRHHRRLLGLTDLAIHRLEELNLADRGRLRPDPATERVIERALRAMPDPVRRRFASRRTVQEALDGMFTLQAALQRERRYGPMEPGW